MLQFQNKLVNNKIKHIKLNKFLFIIAFFTCLSANSQTKKTFKDVVVINGYVKFMPSLSFTDGNDILTHNFIHNRINTKYFLSDKITAKLDIRNRVFYGETVSAIPNYSSFIDSDTGFIDMSWTWLDKKSIVGHTTIDRFYLDYQAEKWELRVGRQRINWGINMAWNSNDLFNAYNLVDFDYQERPGSDAVRFQYYTGDFSHLELAYKPGKSIDKSIIAGLYKFNKWKYDIQFIAANYNTDLAFGTGWAGNIKKAGFKGEGTYFHNKSNFTDTSGSTNISLSVDYSFKNGLYLNGSYLLNTLGQTTTNLLGGNQFFSGALSPKNLMPTKHSYLVQLMGQFNPMLKGSVIVIYGQGMNLLFVMPSLDYEIKSNWNLSLISQIAFADSQNKFKNLGNSLYLRLWYSF